MGSEIEPFVDAPTRLVLYASASRPPHPCDTILWLDLISASNLSCCFRGGAWQTTRTRDVAI